MPTTTPFRAAAIAGIAALFTLGGCAAPRGAVDWNRVSLRDQHLYFPGSGADMHPLVIVTSGANGMVVAGGPPAAAEMVVQDGQVSLLSPATAQAQRAGGTQALGAGQPLPTPPSGVTPQK